MWSVPASVVGMRLRELGSGSVDRTRWVVGTIEKRSKYMKHRKK